MAKHPHPASPPWLCVYDRVINTRDFGLPQFRARQWLVGIRKDLQQQPFRWPRPMDPMPVQHLLAPRHKEPGNRDNMPLSKLAARNVAKAKEHTQTLGPTDDWFLNDHLSANYLPDPRPLKHCPSLLHGKRQGHWIGSRGRRMAAHEVARFQGICYGDLRWQPSSADKHSFLGNSMSICVLERLVVAALSAIGTPLPDRW